MAWSGSNSMTQFQSTLPRRERHGMVMCPFGEWVISIHAPAKGATMPQKKYRRMIGDFNPRSREGSDAALDSLNRKMEISIHAPAKGATMEYTHSASYRQFQSTLPRRERRELAKVLQTSNISIHAPAKGATISYTVS